MAVRLQEGVKVMSQRGQGHGDPWGLRTVTNVTLKCIFSQRKGKIRRLLSYLILGMLMKEFQERGGGSYSHQSENVKLSAADSPF